MIIIGEKLNSSIPKTFQALINRDEEFIISLIQSQEECGAHFLDLNTAVCGSEELSTMIWLINLVVTHSNCGIMIDSPSVPVITQAVSAVNNREVIINSVTLTDRINELLPLIKQTGAWVVALPIDQNGIPDTVAVRVENANRLIEKISNYGINPSKIMIDVLAEAIAVGEKNAIITLETIRSLKQKHPDIMITCGLSNVSFGLPKRVNINCAFLAAAVANGLDSAIIDITSPSIKNTLLASLAVAGRDEYCMNYISNFK